MADDIASLLAKVKKLEKDLTDEAMFKAVGLKGKQIGNQEIKADAGDLSLSNWRRGRPVNMGVRFDTVGDNTLEIGPSKRGRGPARVLNEGRKAGVSRRGRPVSSSKGKGTWDRATADMERQLPKVAHDHVTKVLRKHF